MDHFNLNTPPGSDLLKTHRYDLTPLKGLRLKSFVFHGRVRDLAPLRGMPLKKVWIGGPVSELSPLAGMKLESVRFTDHCTIDDLSPLKGMPLTRVDVPETRVCDLSPLAGARLKELNIAWTPVSDISVIKGMPLERLAIDTWHGGVKKVDLSVVRGMPLKRFTCDVRRYFEPDLQILRGLNLETGPEFPYHGQPIAQYWKTFQARRQAEAEFVRSLAKLAPDDQARAVAAKMFGPNGNDTFRHVVTDGAVTEVSFRTDGRDLWPLRAFSKLRKLAIPGPDGRQNDLSPLVDLPIEELKIGGLVDYNRPVLREMKSLKTINGRPASESLKVSSK